jgi:L-fucose mutarotase
MVPDDGAEQPIFTEFRQLLPQGVDLTKIGRFPFCEEARGKNTAMVIATGEQRVHANLLLTIGVVTP